jgi:hypothetical protein
MDTDWLDEIARRHGIVLFVELGSSMGGPRHASRDRAVGGRFGEGPGRGRSSRS